MQLKINKLWTFEDGAETNSMSCTRLLCTLIVNNLRTIGPIKSPKTYFIILLLLFLKLSIIKIDQGMTEIIKKTRI